METVKTATVKKLSPISKLPLDKLRGVWELTYKVKNSQGPKAFGQYVLGTYDHPVSLLKCPLLNVQRKVQTGFWITNVVMRLTPEKNRNKLIELDWLLSHPEVTLDDYTGLDQAIIDAKRKNSQIKLVCLDRLEMDSLDEEDYIDKLVGVISLDLGKNSLGIERLRGVLAYLGMSYREERYAANKATEKKALRSKLKTYCRKSIANAKRIEKAIDSPDACRYVWEAKEMLRFQIVSMMNGMYTYAGVNIGTSFQGLIDWFHQNPDHYAEAQKKLSKLK